MPALLAQGRTNRQLGAALYISEKTASVHVSNILAELGASGRTEAVAIAVSAMGEPPGGRRAPVPDVPSPEQACRSSGRRG
jgi:hypothetical protein